MRRTYRFCILVLALVVPIAANGADVSEFATDIHDIDMSKAMALMVRQRQGVSLPVADAAFTRLARTYMETVQGLRRRARGNETLTAQEDAFLGLANEAGRRRQAAARSAYIEKNPPRDSTGLVPLTDLTTDYKGEHGGLYPEGSNTPPMSHLAEGLKRAAAIQPLDRNGRPHPDGKVVLLSVGMSNTTQEFRVFIEEATKDPGLNPALVIVDGAQGGQSAGITANPHARYWTASDERLAAAGVTVAQVQAVWIKQGIPRPQEPFPAEARKLQGYLEKTVQNLHDRHPDLKITYVSSRIYGGYAEGDLNPEPHAYEGAFSTRWLIADQITGKPDLNFDPNKGDVRASWIVWGPYLWADGLKHRSDGLYYTRDDLTGDGTHPSMQGRAKVAAQLLKFFKSDPTAKPWFMKK